MGEPEYLGAWDPKRAVNMTEHEYHEWVVSLDATQLPQHFEFKFIICDSQQDFTPIWEETANRSITLPTMKDSEVLVYELAQANFPIYPWKGSGVVVPIFSLRSEGSFGVGDFGDLKSDRCRNSRTRIWTPISSSCRRN